MFQIEAESEPLTLPWPNWCTFWGTFFWRSDTAWSPKIRAQMEVEAKVGEIPAQDIPDCDDLYSYNM